MSSRIPFSLKLIQWLCKEELVEEIQGNLLDYSESLEGGFLNKLKFWMQVLSYLRPAFVKNTQIHTNMFHFNPKVAFRSLLRYRSTTFINLISFITGLSSALFLFFYITEELSIDDFHADKDKIYRVYRTSQDSFGEAYDIGHLSGPYAPALTTDFPQSITESVRIAPNSELVVYKDKQFMEKGLILADPNFFNFFSYPLIHGDRSTVLENVNQIVISESTAKKYFGNEDPMGQVLSIFGANEFEVSGVFKDVENSHLDFDIVASLDIYEQNGYLDNWFPNFLSTYIKISHSQDVDYLSEKFPDFMEKHLSSHMKAGHAINGLNIVPLKQVYFHNPKYEIDLVTMGNYDNLVILIWVSIGLLLISSFNYINLTMAQALTRAKEVAIRKAIGSGKGRLLLQFTGETFLVLLFSFVVAIMICLMLKSAINDQFDLLVHMDFSSFKIVSYIALLFMLLLLGSGLYPALYLSSFKSVQALKAKRISQGNSIYLRKALIISQFGLSIFLICVAMFSFYQVKFMANSDRGFDDEGILVMNANSGIRNNFNVFKNNLLSNSDIMSVSGASGQPGGFHDSYLLEFEPGEEPLRVYTVFSDHHYTQTFDIEIIAGRGFDSDRRLDSASMLVNEKVLQVTGLTAEEVIGKRLHFQFKDYDKRVIGVFKDYQFKGFKEEIQPLAIVSDSEIRRIMIKMKTADIKNTLTKIEDEYNQYAEGIPLESQFLDQQLENQFRAEEQQFALFTIFSSISVILACLGIFGLVAFSAAQRQKEVSIRKVLGASYFSLITKLSKEYIMLVMISAAISFPLAWIYLGEWLSEYAFRIDMVAHIPIFILAAIIILLVSILAIFGKAHEAAVKNPAEMIRND